jgi:hypothetical protein
MSKLIYNDDVTSRLWDLLKQDIWVYISLLVIVPLVYKVSDTEIGCQTAIRESSDFQSRINEQ